MSIISCKKCNKVFANKYSLKVHLENVCERIDALVLICKYCNSTFSSNSGLYKHDKTCPKREEYNLKEMVKKLSDTNQELTKSYEIKLAELTNDFNKAKLDFANIRENNAKAIETLKERVSQEEKKNEYLRGKLKVFQDQSSKQQKQIDDLYKKPTFVNNGAVTINNLFIQNLEPITDELIRETGSKLGIMDLKDGAPGIMRKFQPILKDRVICTDATRNSLMYNYNGQLKRDTRGQMLTDKIISSTEPQFNKLKDEIDNYYKELSSQNMSEDQRLQNDTHFDNYKELCRAMKRKTEFSKKKISKYFSKMISVFSKSKSQFELQIQEKNQYEDQIRSGDTTDVEIPVFSPHNIVQSARSVHEHVKTDGKLNPIVSKKQLLENGRIFEFYYNASGEIIRKIRLRSSGLPYLTDEETDPSSREQSDNEIESDSKENI